MDGVHNDMAVRDNTHAVMVGAVPIGGGAPISVQSMTNTDTRDARSTIAQIARLQAAGCEIVRVAVPDQEAAEALRTIKAGTSIPLVADIHFDYRLAIASLECGVNKLRINPGNIGGESRVREVVAAAKDHGAPIRIGVNAGSLEKDLLAKYGRTPEAMVESALRHIAILEREGFHAIVVSLKASDVQRTAEAYRRMAGRSQYPLHVGVTEAGPPPTGLVKSAVGIGMILAEGIGDTIRVSLTGDPEAEVAAGRDILSSLGLRSFGPTIISCPTCGRCRSDLLGLVSDVRAMVSDIDVPITIAVMGCEVNGPGEAADADLGVALGSGTGLLFSGGKIIGKVRAERIAEALAHEAREAAARVRAGSQEQGVDNR